ncbi:MAG: glycosyltransferase family 4 protein [Blastocatellia bacterium]
MRVLHVHSGNIYGGVETLLTTLARNRDFCPQMQSHFALCFDGRLEEELIAAEMPVYRLGSARISRPWTLLSVRRALRELLRRERFDVVVCHSAWTLAIFGPVVRAARVPLVFWLHATSDGRHWLERWAKGTTPDLVLCNSRFTASKKSLLFPQVRGELIYCPVTLPERRYTRTELYETRDELRTPQEAVVIIQISRLEPYKGHSVLLEALGLLSDLSDWVYWQVGEAKRPFEVDYLRRLKAAAIRLGIQERVRFLGWQPDAHRLLAAADIYCQPNTWAEPFGITFVEALFAGLPVVTTAMGGPKEIVDESCGVLVPPDDPKALANSLRSLIEDTKLRASFGDAGPGRARELCDPETQIRKLYQLLAAITNEHPKETPQRIGTA